MEAVSAAEEAIEDHDATGNPHVFILTAANVHAVKTHEGAVALVDILEDNPPRRTRLRYKLAQNLKAPPGLRSAREVTLHDWDVQPEALDFETGWILAIPDETRQQLRGGNLDWFVNNGVDLMTDTTRKGVGLLTMLTNELQLVKLADEEWDSLTPARWREALSRGASGLETRMAIASRTIGNWPVLATCPMTAPPTRTPMG